MIHLKLKVEHWFFQEIGTSEERAPPAASPGCISGFHTGTPEAGRPAGGGGPVRYSRNRLGVKVQLVFAVRPRERPRVSVQTDPLVAFLAVQPVCSVSPSCRLCTVFGLRQR